MNVNARLIEYKLITCFCFCALSCLSSTWRLCSLEEVWIFKFVELYFVGSKRWLDWRKEIELLSDLVYYGLTTFSGSYQPKQLEIWLHLNAHSFLLILWSYSPGYQTLGEEYVSIVQVDPTRRRIPSRARRCLLVLCHAFLPYLLDKVLVCLENELERGQQSVSRRQAAAGPWSLQARLRRWIQRAVQLLSEPQRRACLTAVFGLQQGLTLLHRLHVALFYISGSFYHLSKRVAGITYVWDFL